jgi:hypothetical protein
MRGISWMDARRKNLTVGPFGYRCCEGRGSPMAVIAEKPSLGLV